jgi:hypothetical protein
MIARERISLKNLDSRIPAPPGVSAEEWMQMLERNPKLLEEMKRKTGEEVGAVRKAYQRMVPLPLSDKEFEDMINDPELQGRLAGEKDRDRKKRVSQYAKAYSAASRF